MWGSAPDTIMTDSTRAINSLFRFCCANALISYSAAGISHVWEIGAYGCLAGFKLGDDACFIAAILIFILRNHFEYVRMDPLVVDGWSFGCDAIWVAPSDPECIGVFRYPDVIHRQFYAFWNLTCHVVNLFVFSRLKRMAIFFATRGNWLESFWPVHIVCWLEDPCHTWQSMR